MVWLNLLQIKLRQHSNFNEGIGENVVVVAVVVKSNIKIHNGTINIIVAA